MEKKFVTRHVNNAPIITEGVPVSKEIACGKLVFNSLSAQKLSAKGEKVILAQNVIAPEDIEGINVAQGIITSRNNLSAYTLMITRTLKKSCIATYDMLIDEDNNYIKVGDKIYEEGTVISLDGYTGKIYTGAIPEHHKLGWNDLAREELKNRGEKVYSKVA